MLSVSLVSLILKRSVSNPSTYSGKVVNISDTKSHIIFVNSVGILTVSSLVDLDIIISLCNDICLNQSNY